MSLNALDLTQYWSTAQHEKAQEIDTLIQQGAIETMRFAFADQHGLVRGKTVMASQVKSLLRSGLGMVSTILLKDSSHRTVYSVFGQGENLEGVYHGASDVLLAADPSTFCILPWAHKTGWVLCNAVTATPLGSSRAEHGVDGVHGVQAAPFCTRSLYQRALAVLASQGYGLNAGLEVEFYLFKLEDTKLTLNDAGWPGSPPEVSLLNTGYQLLTEQRIDQLDEPVSILRRTVQQMGMPLTSVEIELGPSQVEFVFGPQPGLQAADTMVLFRNAAKQVMRRHGYHVSFMCRPKIPHVMSSGWHLHQSLVQLVSGANSFAPTLSTSSNKSAALSPVGMQYLAGLIEHARACSVFSTPTVNGYRRYRPHSLAPDRANWGLDNRGVMLRVVGQGEATRIENRIGEPAANPYLYMASQVYSGLDGIARQLTPPPSSDNPYDSPAEPLPRSLAEALTGLAGDEYMNLAFGETFVNYYVRLKNAELTRYDAQVSEWEQQEYFDLF